MATQLVRCKVPDKDIPPIAVNFSIFFGASLVVLAIGSLILAGKTEERVIITTKIISLFLALLLVIGLLAGLEGSPVTCAAGACKLGTAGKS